MEKFVHAELRYESGKQMEFDIFLPKENIAFEYQGEQHYADLYHIGTLWQQKQRDKEKRKACKEREITLIEVPFWWDEQISSLAATIHKEKNDLLPQGRSGDPIPAQPIEYLGNWFFKTRYN